MQFRSQGLDVVEIGASFALLKHKRSRENLTSTMVDQTWLNLYGFNQNKGKRNGLPWSSNKNRAGSIQLPLDRQ